MGRGPPYVRAEGVGQEPTRSVWHNPRRIVDENSEDESQGKITRLRSEKADYSLGLLDINQRLEQESLKDQIIITTREDSKKHTPKKTEVGGNVHTSASESEESYSDSESNIGSPESSVNWDDRSDTPAAVSRILYRNKQLVIRRLMAEYRKIIGSSGSQEPRDEGGARDSTRGSERADFTSGRASGHNSTSARRTREPQDADDSDSRDNGKRPAKRVRSTTPDPTANCLKLACPYYQRNPLGPRIGPSCGGPGWNTIHRLK